MKLNVISTTGVRLNATPFAAGFNAVAVNFTAGAIALTGSDDNITYTALVTAPAGGMVEIPSLPKWIKAASGSVYIIE